MGFWNLVDGVKHLGRRVVDGVGNGLNAIRNVGERVYNGVKKIPVVGDIAAAGLEKLYNTSIPGVGLSARDAFEGANKAVETGKQLLSDDAGSRQKGLDRVRAMGAKAAAGDYGSRAQEVAQKGSDALNRMKSVLG